MKRNVSNKISALIFSINEYDLVYPKIKLLYPYVDEIVIIDSSTDKKQKRLMKNLEKKYKKVRVVWLPPLGVVEFYYKIGINECKYDWIFQLDADDIPSKKLLEDLRKLVNDKYDAYKIYRKYKDHKSHETLFRLIKKNVAYPTGIIHWVMASSSKNYRQLNPKKYYIEHRHRKFNVEFSRKKGELYETIEVFQLGAKILFFFSKKAYLWFEYPRYFNSIKKIVDIIKKFGKIGLLILLIVWNFSYFLLTTKRQKKFSPINLKYTIILIFKIFRDFHYKYLAYIFQHNLGVFRFLGIENKEEIDKISKMLNLENDGLKNFKSLLFFRLRKFYQENFVGKYKSTEVCFAIKNLKYL